MEMPQLDEEEMQMVYNWVDEIPLSRPKRNIARDFSDGVLMAEVVKHYIPHLVELHNYSAAHSVQQKTYNWNTLNQKVFKKIGFTLTKKDIEDSVNCVSDTIERILKVLQSGIQTYQEKKAKKAMQGGLESSNQGALNQMNPFIAQNQFNKENNLGGGGGYANYNSQQQQQQYTLGNQGIPNIGGGVGKPKGMLQNQVDTEILIEKEQTIQQLKETIEILELKIKKLEQLVNLKDAKIQNLSNKLQSAGILQ